MAEAGAQGLSFDRAEGGGEGEGEGPASCSACGTPIRQAYYQVNGAVVCAACQGRKVAEREGGSPVARFVRAAAFGALAAVAGALLWYGIGKITGYEFGLIAIVVGLMVGGAVRLGSRRRGGWLYQALAIFLTYASIVSTYIPMILEGAMESDVEQIAAIEAAAEVPVTAEPSGVPPAAVAAEGAAGDSQPVEGGAGGGVVGLGIGLLLLFAFAFAAPFLGGFENFMGWIILAIGLYEAWKLNRREELVVEGPYRVAGARPEYVPEPPPPPIQP